MKRLWIALTISLLLQAVTFAEEKETFTSGDYEYTLLDDGTAEITKYIGGEENPEVASELDGHAVTYIGKYAFKDCKEIKSITLPESVIGIGDYAFDSCENLDSITFPYSIEEIGNNPFVNCENVGFIVPEEHECLREIEGVLYYRISDKAGEANAKLVYCPDTKDSYEISEHVKSIGAYAFLGCEKLSDITIDNGVTSIGACAFDSCTSLTGVTLPESVEEVEENPFTRCPGIEIQVSEANENLEIKDGVLFDKKNNRLICFPDTAEAYSVPEGTESIATRAFFECNNLKSITLPDGITTIGKRAFSNCENLSTVTVPATVTAIEENAFDGCSNLTVTTVQDSYAARYCEEAGVNYTIPDNEAEEAENYNTDDIITVCEEYTRSFKAALPNANSLYRNHMELLETASAEEIEPLEAFMNAKTEFDALQTDLMTEEQVGYYEEAAQSVEETEVVIIEKTMEEIGTGK